MNILNRAIPPPDPGLISVILLVALAALIPELFMPGYYHWDDNMHLFLPTMYEIGTHLRSGHLAWITDRSWFGGNLIGEGQFALFNPVSLILYAVISTFQDTALAALVFSAFHLCLMAAGVYQLARNIGVSDRLSTCAAFAFTCSNQVSYWYAAGWWNALVADAWLILALAFWVRYLNSGKGLFVATVFGAISMLSGWPHGWLALGACIGLFAIIAYRNGAPQKALKILVGGGCTLIAAMPGIIPTLVYSMQSVRPSNIYNNGDMVGTIEALVMGSWPSLLSATQRIYGWKPELPLYYSAWFVLPAIVFFGRNWYENTPPVRKSLLLLPLGLFALLSLSPERILMLRWSMRFLPYFNLFLILLAADALSRKNIASAQPQLRLFAITGLLGYYYCLTNSAADLSTHIFFSALWITCALLLLVWIGRQSEKGIAISVLVSSFAIFVATHETWPRNTNLPNWHGPVKASLDIFEHRQAPFSGNIFLVHSSASRTSNHANSNISSLVASLESSDAIPSGAMAMWSINNTVNGYSAIPHKGIQKFFCFNNWGHSSCKNALEKIFSLDPELGIRNDQLFRINEIRIPRNTFTNIATTIPDDWTKADETDDVITYRSIRLPTPNLVATTVNYVEQGLSAKAGLPAKTNTEELVIENPTKTTKKLVFARPYYPGYSATLNNKNLDISVTSDIFVTAIIPPGTSGKLLLSFAPPYFNLTLSAAVLSLILALMLSLHRQQR